MRAAGRCQMAEDRITRDDLGWWLEFTDTRTWTFATTYADTAPHDYIVQSRTPGVTHEDVVRAARVICTFGAPGKYYGITKIYLVSPDGSHRWWTEDRHFTDATLVNRGTTRLHYCVQNALSTATGSDSPYDEVATAWDARHPAAEREAERVKHLLAGVRGTYPPHVLDLGCGTGRVLDLGLVSPERMQAWTPAGRCSTSSCASIRTSRHCTRLTSGKHWHRAPSPRVSSTGCSSMRLSSSTLSTAPRSSRSLGERPSLWTGLTGQYAPRTPRDARPSRLRGSPPAPTAASR